MFPTQEQIRTIQQEEIDRVIVALKKVPISVVTLLADSLENHYATSGSFQSATGTLAVAIMKQLGVKVRVAEWYIDSDGRCQYKRNAIGSQVRAKVGNMEDETWIEAWIV